jgi:hypothetical protein
MRVVAVVAIAVAVSACTPMPHKKVIGPDMTSYKVTEHEVGCWEMTQRCAPNIPFPIKPLLVMPMGCATVNFDKRTCDIYVCSMSPGFVLKHERQHCEGWDHGGVIQAGWDNYVQALIAKGQQQTAAQSLEPGGQ